MQCINRAAVRRCESKLVFFTLLLLLAASAFSKHRDGIMAILFGENCIQKWIRARIQWIDEHQEDFSLSDIDEAVTSKSREPKERYRSPTDEVRKHLEGF